VNVVIIQRGTVHLFIGTRTASYVITFLVECYDVAMQCSDKLKSAFTSVGAFSAEQNFICGDPEGVIKWIEGQIEEFDEVLTGKGDFCACVGVRGAFEGLYLCLKKLAVNMQRL
jgi:hypothetical protein